MDIEMPDGTKTKRVKHPIPDGYVTPTELVQHLAFAGTNANPTKEAEDGKKINIGAQTVYNWARNLEDFPSIEHTDGRTIISRKDGLKWVSTHLDEIQAKQARRKANSAKRKERVIKGLLSANRSFALAAASE